MNRPENKSFSSREEEVGSSDAIPDALPGENQAKVDPDEWLKNTFGKTEREMSMSPDKTGKVDRDREQRY